MRQVTIEYVLRSGEKEIPSVFLREVRDANQERLDNNSLAMVDLVANEALSFDTCFRLFLALKKGISDYTTSRFYRKKSYYCI